MAASHRLFATSLVVRITGRVGASAEIGLTAAAKTTCDCLWERLWTPISWGVSSAAVSAAD